MSESEEVRKKGKVEIHDSPTSIGMWQWGVREDGGILETSDLGPCISLGIYDPENSKGYLAHLVLPSESAQELDEVITEVLQASPDLGMLRVWLGGGLIVSEETLKQEHDLGVADRAAVLTRLHDLGISDDQIESHWTNRTDEHVVMSLDTSQGQCSMTTFPYTDV